jgi:hypothetical protein
MRDTPKMGLHSWNDAPDLYNFQQLDQNWQILDFHDHSPGRGVQIPAGGIAPGAVGLNELAPGLLIGAGISGSAIIPAAQSTVSNTFTPLTTPDQVTGLILPEAGLIAVWYQAVWSNTVASSGVAALFLGSTQVASWVTNAGPVAQQATHSSNTTVFEPLTSWSGGLNTVNLGGATGSNITTGQILGADLQGGAHYGPCYIFADAGTYTVGVQFKALNGSVTVSDRRFYAKVVSF